MTCQDLADDGLAEGAAAREASILDVDVKLSRPAATLDDCCVRFSERLFRERFLLTDFLPSSKLVANPRIVRFDSG